MAWKDSDKFKRSADFYIRGIITTEEVYTLPEFKNLVQNKIRKQFEKEQRKKAKEKRNKQFLEKAKRLGF